MCDITKRNRKDSDVTITHVKNGLKVCLWKPWCTLACLKHALQPSFLSMKAKSEIHAEVKPEIHVEVKIRNSRGVRRGRRVGERRQWQT